MPNHILLEALWREREDRVKAEAKRTLLLRAAFGEARCIQGSDRIERKEQGLGAIIVARLQSLGEWGHQSRHGDESCGPEAL